MIGMPLACDDETFDLLSPLLQGWLAVAEHAPRVDDGDALAWSDDRLDVAMIDHSLRLASPKGRNPLIVLLPTPVADPSRQTAMTAIGSLRDAVERRIDPASAAARDLQEGLRESVRDIAAVHATVADRIQVNLGIGRPDAVRASVGAGTRQARLADVDPIWVEHVSRVPFRHATMRRLTGPTTIIPVEGAGVVESTSGLDAVDILRRLRNHDLPRIHP